MINKIPHVRRPEHVFGPVIRGLLVQEYVDEVSIDGHVAELWERQRYVNGEAEQVVLVDLQRIGEK